MIVTIVYIEKDTVTLNYITVCIHCMSVYVCLNNNFCVIVPVMFVIILPLTQRKCMFEWCDVCNGLLYYIPVQWSHVWGVCVCAAMYAIWVGYCSSWVGGQKALIFSVSRYESFLRCSLDLASDILNLLPATRWDDIVSKQYERWHCLDDYIWCVFLCF